MYLMRVGAIGAERPALRIDDDTYLDLSAPSVTPSVATSLATSPAPN